MFPRNLQLRLGEQTLMDNLIVEIDHLVIHEEMWNCGFALAAILNMIVASEIWGECKLPFPLKFTMAACKSDSGPVK